RGGAASRAIARAGGGRRVRRALHGATLPARARAARGVRDHGPRRRPRLRLRVPGGAAGRGGGGRGGRGGGGAGGGRGGGAPPPVIRSPLGPTGSAGRRSPATSRSSSGCCHGCSAC